MSEIIKKIKEKLAPLIPVLKVVGERALKEIILPYLIKRAKEKAGLGYHSRTGGALKLAGQGKHKKKKALNKKKKK